MTMDEAIRRKAPVDPVLRMSDREYDAHVRTSEQEQQFFRHLGTLSTGSIVILGTFIGKLSAQPHSRWLVVLSLFGFAASLVGSVSMNAISLLWVDAPGSAHWIFSRPIGWAVMVMGFGGFVAGVLALVAFAIANL